VPDLGPQETPLNAWLDAHPDWSAYRIAQLMGISYATVGSWRWGRYIPGVVHAFKLEAVTNGGVPASSWLGMDSAKRIWAGTSDLVKQQVARRRSVAKNYYKNKAAPK